MPTYRARVFRTVLKWTLGRRLRSAGSSVDRLRRLEPLMVRSQRPPKGTTVSPVSRDALPAEWVLGPGARADAAILYLHGGAFVVGSPATHRELVARVSMAGAARVLSLDYRLAPEFPFPAAVDDVRTAYRWLLEEGYGPHQLVVGGDSSGGGLALQALLSLRDEGTTLPCGAFFMSPQTEWVAFRGESYVSRASLDPLVSPSQCRYTASLYAGRQADHPLLRPTETSLSGLPPLWIHVGDHEVLLSDAERLARKAVRDGVEVDFRIWPGMWHVFQAGARYVPESRQSLEDLARFLGARFGH